MRNKTTEVTEGHREGVFGIVEYIHEELILFRLIMRGYLVLQCCLAARFLCFARPSRTRRS